VAVLSSKESIRAATSSTSKSSPTGVRLTRHYSLTFLQTTRLPTLERHGQQGEALEYPEWLRMLIGVLAVKCTEPTYRVFSG
jgi:hypothetical protein